MPRQLLSCHRKRAGSMICEGPCGPYGWKRDAGSANGPRPSTKNEYESNSRAGAKPEKYPLPSSANTYSASCIRTDTVRCSCAHTRKPTPSGEIWAPTEFGHEKRFCIVDWVYHLLE